MLTLLYECQVAPRYNLCKSETHSLDKTLLSLWHSGFFMTYREYLNQIPWRENREYICADDPELGSIRG